MRQTTTSCGLAHREIGTLRTDEPGSRIWGFRSSPTDFWRNDERGDTGVGRSLIDGAAAVPSDERRNMGVGRSLIDGAAARLPMSEGTWGLAARSSTLPLTSQAMSEGTWGLA